MCCFKEVSTMSYHLVQIERQQTVLSASLSVKWHLSKSIFCPVDKKPIWSYMGSYLVIVILNFNSAP